MRIPVIRTAAFFAAAITGFACGSGSDDGTPEVSTSQVKQEAGDAVDTAMQYAAQKKDELVARANRAASDAEGELERARKDLAALPAESRERLEEAIERAATARDALRSEIEELQAAGAESLATAQERLAAALDEMAEARAEVASALTEGEAAGDASS